MLSTQTIQTQNPHSPGLPGKLHLCALPHCQESVLDAWEDTGTMCASCAIETDLSDRAGRWDRVFPAS